MDWGLGLMDGGSWGRLEAVTDCKLRCSAEFLSSRRQTDVFMSDHWSGGKRGGIITALTSITGLKTTRRQHTHTHTIILNEYKLALFYSSLQ